MLRTSDFLLLISAVYLAPALPGWLATTLSLVLTLTSFWFQRRGD